MKEILNYIDIVLLLLLLMFLFFYFKRLLGKKIGYQKQEMSTEISQEGLITTTRNSSKTVDVPKSDNYKYPIGSLMQKIEIIEENDDQFSPKSFILSSKKAFEMIINSFYNGDISDVKDFLSEKVYETFNLSINNRSDENKKLNIEIKQFNLSEIIDVKINKNFDAFISVKYLTLQLRGSKDNKKSLEISDIWVFSKNIKENTSIWKLIKTY